MAADCFLKLGPIKGESKDKTHKDEIEVLSFSWNLTQTGSFHSGTGGGTGRVSVGDVSLSKHMDVSSPDLLHYLSVGKHIDKAVLVCRKAGDQPLEYFTLTLEDVLVSSYSQSGTGDGGEKVHENISLNFSKFKAQYKQQTEKGAVGASPDFAYDVAAHHKI